LPQKSNFATEPLRGHVVLHETDEAQLGGVSLDKGQMVDGVHLALRW
jgi:hypothetical protein